LTHASRCYIHAAASADAVSELAALVREMQPILNPGVFVLLAKAEIAAT
jgi:hypothetical protein